MSRKSRNMFYQNTSASRSAEIAESCMEKMENKPDDSTVTRRLLKEKRWLVLLMFRVTGVDKRFQFLSNSCLNNLPESKNFLCLCRIVLKTWECKDWATASSRTYFFCYPKKVSESAKLFV